MHVKILITLFSKPAPIVTALSTVLAFGPNSQSPHASPSNMSRNQIPLAWLISQGRSFHPDCLVYVHLVLHHLKPLTSLLLILCVSPTYCISSTLTFWSSCLMFSSCIKTLIHSSLHVSSPVRQRE